MSKKARASRKTVQVQSETLTDPTAAETGGNVAEVAVAEEAQPAAAGTVEMTYHDDGSVAKETAVLARQCAAGAQTAVGAMAAFLAACPEGTPGRELITFGDDSGAV